MNLPTYFDRREVVQVTDYEMLMIVLGILGLMFAFGSLILALLAFIHSIRTNKRK